MNAEETSLGGHVVRAALAAAVAGVGYVAFPAHAPGLGVAVGELGLAALITALFGLILRFFRPEIYRSLHAMTFFAGGFGVVMVAAGLIARDAPPLIELVPIALPVFLFAVLFDGRIAAVAAMALAALVGTQPTLRSGEAMAFVFLAGAGGALSLGRISSRTQAYTFVISVTAIYAATAAVVGLARNEPLDAIGTSAALGGINAFGSAALAMLLLPIAETWTRTTTDLRLLELSDPSRPLLRRLATEAPGTWAHSIALANLCEAACNAIGANGLLARVGCYYHDVGKLANPQLFAENARHGSNPHRGLTPEQSAILIRRHVEDGLRLAREHRLPDVIQRFIPEHHGTQAIAFFREQARNGGAGIAADEHFHYPGPRPQTAETAVALLGDSVEAALRVLDDPTPQTLEDAITHLIEGRVEGGQLAEAPLTLRQIEMVRREFLHVLAGMYHNRVAYPEDAGGISADWEAPPAA